MGLFIFITAVLVEIIFTLYCLMTKSHQEKVKSMTRITAFVVFVLSCILPIIDWSSRYYAIATLLLLLAIIGVMSLICKREEKRPYKATRVVFKGIGMTMLIFVFTLPAIIFPQHEAMKTTGQYQVATESCSYMDTKRIETYSDTGENRKLNVQMWFPESAAGKFPLIVFSHGAFGMKNGFVHFYNSSPC